MKERPHPGGPRAERTERVTLVTLEGLPVARGKLVRGDSLPGVLSWRGRTFRFFNRNNQDNSVRLVELAAAVAVEGFVAIDA